MVDFDLQLHSCFELVDWLTPEGATDLFSCTFTSCVLRCSTCKRVISMQQNANARKKTCGACLEKAKLRSLLRRDKLQAASHRESRNTRYSSTSKTCSTCKRPNLSFIEFPTPSRKTCTKCCRRKAVSRLQDMFVRSCYEGPMPTSLHNTFDVGDS